MLDKNPHAVVLGRLGGKALARKMTPKQRQAWARLGGLTRSRKYSKEQLSRWAKLGGRLSNVFLELKEVINKTVKLTPRSHLIIPLPEFHSSFVRSLHSITDYYAVQRVGRALGIRITSLEEYLDACRRIFQAYKDSGAVGFKDQLAYQRSLHFENPTRAEAEKVSNCLGV